MDTTGLVATGAWKSRQVAAVYENADVSEEARKVASPMGDPVVMLVDDLVCS